MIKSPISHFQFQQFDFSSYLAYKREGFVGREWFFSELENIFETDRGTAGVLITGEPGSGKSALMSQLVCSPYSSLLIHQNIIGYHVCEYSEKGKRDGARFVRNLVDQIAARLPGYSEHVIRNEQMRRELDTLCQQDVTGCFFTSILGPLRELKPPGGLRYIVIDALDECLESDKTSEIIEILSSKILHFPKWLKVILTSRNLTQVTGELPQVVRRKPLYANDDRNVKDIRLYVSRFISQNSFFVDRLKIAMNFKSRTYDMKIFLDEVVSRAEGNFLFVKMTLQYMNDTDGVVDPKSLPTSLFDLYNIFFKRQFGKGGFGPFWERAVLGSLFEVLLAVCSPLQLNDVEEILRSEYEAEDVSQLIEQASCFLRFGRDGTVRIYHQSFAEWLVNQAALVHINETRAHRNIANFLLHRIRERDMNVTFGEVIELCMHILAGNTLGMHGNAIDLLNISEMRDSRTSQSILHHLAIKPSQYQPVLDFFLQKFRIVDILDERKKTPAFYAASEGLVANLRSFIDRGADISSFLEGFRELDPFLNVVRNTSIEEFSLIHAAAAKGHRDVVELLIKSNVSFYKSSKNYPTPLYLAAGNGHLEVLRLFYDYGAKFNVITLHHAAARNHLDVVEFLLTTVGVRDSCIQCTCKPEQFSKYVHLHFCETALHAAVSRGYMDIVKILLLFGNESLECKHHSGKTVLMDAVERNDIEMVDLLLENGANVTAQCGSKISKKSRNEMCSLSSKYKQDLLYTVYCTEDSCECGNAAIHVSAKYGLWKVAEKLVSKQVFDLTNLTNCDNEYALAVAISHGHTHFLYHTNETYKRHGHHLVDSAIVQGAVTRFSDSAVKHILDYPINYIYEHTWELLLLSVTHWTPYDRYRWGLVWPYICPEVYEDEDFSLVECIERLSKKSLAIIRLLTESYKSFKEKSFFLNKKDDKGRTLLHHAARSGFDDAVKYLVQIGANTQIKDEDGESPLTFALTRVFKNSFPNHNAWYRCYTTNDDELGSCYTTNYDEIVRYLIWSGRTTFPKCDDSSASLLKQIIQKQMPLSLYELLKAGVDMNCTENESVSRPFLKHLRLGGRQLSEVFQIFEVDISLECGTTFTSSELHLISYLAVPDDLGNFFKPLIKDRSPLQKMFERHPDGVGILEKCYDIEGYLPLHRAVQGGNLNAIKWFKSVGVNTQLKTRRGLTALGLSMLYLSDISQAELIASIKSTPYSWRRSEHQVPLTVSNYRTEVFEELLRTFFNATPESEFPCGASLEGLSPLHIAAVKGISVLRYVHRKASEKFPNLPLNCTNKHQLDPVYVAHFYESLLNEGLIDKYSKDSDVNFEQETKTSKKVDSKTNNKIKNGSRSDRTNVNGNDSRDSMPLVQYPDREMEYYMAFKYLYRPPCSKYTDEHLHMDIPKDIRISDCPGYHDKISVPKEETVPDVDFTECSKIQVRHNYYLPLCEREISQNHIRKYPCPTMTRRLRRWFMSHDHQRRNRQISQFVAKRLGWDDVPEVKDIKNRWPLFFLHNMVLNKYESWEYLTILNEALEVADVRFYSRNEPLDVILNTPIQLNITIEYKSDKDPESTN
jgi:ankyrin repeat protein